MHKPKHRAKQELDSLIPAIKSEEKHLEDLLAETRTRAEAMLRDAEAQAAAQVQAAREALPGVLETERQVRQAGLEAKAAEAARAEKQKSIELERRARAAMEATVKYIVSIVWPAPGNPPTVTK